jgi:hypothetical protein
VRVTRRLGCVWGGVGVLLLGQVGGVVRPRIWRRGLQSPDHAWRRGPRPVVRWLLAHSFFGTHLFFFFHTHLVFPFPTPPQPIPTLPKSAVPSTASHLHGNGAGAGPGVGGGTRPDILVSGAGVGVGQNMKEADPHVEGTHPHKATLRENSGDLEVIHRPLSPSDPFLTF